MYLASIDFMEKRGGYAIGRAFIGRRRELAALERAFAEPRSGLWPVYGRRRVGKTELIRQFMRHRPGVYFLGKQAPAPMQVREFLRVAAAELDEPLLATQAIDGWEAALATVVDRWRGPGKLVLALDEFQWSASASPELPSVLQALWDGSWRDSDRVFVILCGSFIGFMEREVLGRESPLFGRRTGQIQLQPFDFREAAGFHPAYSLRDRAVTNFVCGGIPLYLLAFDEGQSVEDNIATQLLDPHAPLHREPDFLLREELQEVERYHGILLAVATGDSTPALISERTGVDVRKLAYYFQQLVDLGYLRRRKPLVPGPATRRAVRYAIADPLLRFWFRFLFPQLSAATRLGPRRALRELVRPGLPAYWGQCFESLCREALPDLLAGRGAGPAVEVGEYWDRDMQIDVVGLRDDARIELGGCKWGRVRSARQVVADLADRATRYPNPGNATVGLRIFTASDVAPAVSDRYATAWTTLAELYGAPTA